MTDKDLLIRAAKAGGIEGEYIGGDIVRKDGDKIIFWNSRKNGEDALRLAIKLGMLLELNQEVCFEATTEHEHAVAYLEDNGGDAFAATCMAITSVAADCWKGPI